MMNFNEFKDAVVSEMEQRIGNGEVQIQNVVKNNDVQLTGLVIMRPNVNLSPTIYLEKFYVDLSRKDFSEIADEIWDTYLQNEPAESVNISSFMQWDMAREHIVAKLVNYDQNKELLKSVPYSRFLNLAIVYYYIVDVSEKGAATILVHNHHMKMWGVSRDELNEVACYNYKRIYKVTINSMRDILVDILGGNLCESDSMLDELQTAMYVVTNQWKLNGATALLFPEELKPIANQWKTDLYILPSSLHEIIVLPKLDDDVTSLRNIVTEVNESAVDEVERLSDSIYYYSRESGEISIALERYVQTHRWHSGKYLYWGVISI